MSPVKVALVMDDSTQENEVVGGFDFECGTPPGLLAERHEAIRIASRKKEAGRGGGRNNKSRANKSDQ